MTTMKKFKTTYSALLSTLYKTYGHKGGQSLNNTTKLWASDSGKDLIYKEWVELTHTNDVRQLVESSEPTVFLQGHKAFERLAIPTLWVRGLFSDKSKLFIWNYLSELLSSISSSSSSSSLSLTTVKEEKEDGLKGLEGLGDLQGLGGLLEGANLGSILSSISPEMMKSLSSLAENVSGSDNNYLSSLDPSIMKELVCNMSGAIQKIVKSGDVANLLGELTATMNNIKKAKDI
jgi:hypothetical protein